MIPTPAMLAIVQALIAEDPGSLAPVADGLLVHLAKASFNPASVLIPADITEADFTGSAALEAGVGACQEFFDPTTGLRVIQLNEPAGGWHWAATNTSNLPQSIHGWYVTDNANAVLFGSQLFDSPIPILSAGDGVDVDQVRFSMSIPTLQ